MCVLTNSAVGPELQIIDGKIVVNTESLVLREQHVDDHSDYTFVDSGDHVTTSSSFAKRSRPDRWSVEETRRFYRALRKCGADFTLIQRMFPDRSRRQIKNKFRREERNHRELVDKVLACKELLCT